MNKKSKILIASLISILSRPSFAGFPADAEVEAALAQGNISHACDLIDQGARINADQWRGLSGEKRNSVWLSTCFNSLILQGAVVQEDCPSLIKKALDSKSILRIYEVISLGCQVDGIGSLESSIQYDIAKSRKYSLSQDIWNMKAFDSSWRGNTTFVKKALQESDLDLAQALINAGAPFDDIWGDSPFPYEKCFDENIEMTPAIALMRHRQSPLSREEIEEVLVENKPCDAFYGNFLSEAIKSGLSLSDRLPQVPTIPLLEHLLVESPGDCIFPAFYEAGVNKISLKTFRDAVRFHIPDRENQRMEQARLRVSMYRTFLALQGEKNTAWWRDIDALTPETPGMVPYFHYGILTLPFHQVEEMIQRYPSKVNELDQDGVPPLFRAIGASRFPTALKLLDAGANAQYLSPEKKSIFFAFEDDALAPNKNAAGFVVFKKLLDLGASLGEKDINGDSFFHVTENIHPWIFRLGMEAGLSLDAPNNKGLTPLDLGFSLNKNTLEYTSDSSFDLIKIAINVESHREAGLASSVPKIGFVKASGTWSMDALGSLKKHFSNQVQFYLLSEEVFTEVPHLVQQLDGIVTPGGADNYPKGRPFTLADLNPETMISIERLYQQAQKISSDFQMPLFGMCAGHQHIALYHGATLLEDKSRYARQKGAAVFPGTLLYDLALTTKEREQIHNTCIVPTLRFEKIHLAHSFAAIFQNFPYQELEISALSEGNVIESVSQGWLKIGTQFHPENYLKQGGVNNRQALLFENFINVVRQRNEVAERARQEGANVSAALQSFGEKRLAQMRRVKECYEKQGMSFGGNTNAFNGTLPFHF